MIYLLCEQGRDQSGHLTDDISINLANVHLKQNRFADAEHLYLSALRSAPKSALARGEKIAALCEQVAMAQYRNKRTDESVSSLAKALRLEPGNFRLWFNMGVVRHDVATNTIMGKQDKTKTDIQDASMWLDAADRIFTFLGARSSAEVLSHTRGIIFDKPTVLMMERNCKVG